MSKLNVYLSADQRLYSEYLPNLPHGHFKQEKGYGINLWYSGVKKILILRFNRKDGFATKLVVRKLQGANDAGNDKLSVRESGLTYLIASKSYAKSK